MASDLAGLRPCIISKAMAAKRKPPGKRRLEGMSLPHGKRGETGMPPVLERSRLLPGMKRPFQRAFYILREEMTWLEIAWWKN